MPESDYIDINLKDLISRIRYNNEYISPYNFLSRENIPLRHSLVECKYQLEEVEKKLNSNDDVDNFTILNHPIRRRMVGFNSLPYFKPASKTNKKGLIEVTIQLSDIDQLNNYSIVAIAGTETQFGVTVQSFN